MLVLEVDGPSYVVRPLISMMIVILILTSWVGVLLGSIQGCTTTKEEYKHHQEEGRGLHHLSISEAKKLALEEAILGQAHHHQQQQQQEQQHGTDDDNTTNSANMSSSLPYTITVHDNGRPLVGSQDVDQGRTCELNIHDNYGTTWYAGPCTLLYSYHHHEYVLNRIRCVDGEEYDGEITPNDPTTTATTISEISRFGGLLHDCETLATVLNRYLVLRKSASTDIRLMTLIARTAAAGGGGGASGDQDGGDLCAIEISRSGPTYAVLKRNMIHEGWYIKYMIVHSDSLGCSQLRVLLGVTSDDEEEGAAYYVVPWLGITDEQIPIAHAIEYYNVLKLLPTHHHKDAAYALLRKGGIPEARAAEAVKMGYDDDDERAAMAITMKDKIKDITAYITPLLTKLIIPIAKHEDGHDGGGGGLGMQQDDKKGDGDYCRFGIRGTGLEFTITHTAGAGSPGGGNYLSGVYCGQELLHDDNDGRRFLMDFFNTKKKAQKAASSSATTKFESSGDKTIDEMMKWVKEMMTEYSKGEGQRKSIDNVMASGNRGAVRTTGGQEFAIAKRAQARLKDRFPRYIKAVLDYVNQTESFYENARSVISEVRSQVLPRGPRGLMKLRRKLGERIVEEKGKVKKAFVHIFDELKDIERNTGKEVSKTTKVLNQMIAKAMRESLRDVSRQASQLTRLCFSAEKEIGRKFKTLRRSVGSEQKKLVRSVDRMERDFKADERDFQRYGERFSEETAKGEQKIEKVTRGMNDRAERTETELALYGNDYTAKGEMRINQTLPRAD
ncbi:hypothetical protein FOZ60_016464 [Perkinsus olseni]|uniref:Uncharacterized protein n=1 Tax=Perkinsus olseni TaxID=32597 RepID=A0A7J6P6K9_PEROL|nr:hypothetical protein FOZ60_016464 [Perkinsus olseni]